MGLIVDEYATDEMAWKPVSLSDPESVKGLIRLRTHFDQLYGIESTQTMRSCVHIGNQLEEVTVTYAWLDDIISKTPLTDRQKSVLQRHMDGMSVDDIALDDSVDPSNVRKMLNLICKNISNENHRQWLIWVHKTKLGTPMKKCTVCGNELPNIDKFFYRGYKDTLRDTCIQCHNKK